MTKAVCISKIGTLKIKFQDYVIRLETIKVLCIKVFLSFKTGEVLIMPLLTHIL